MRPGKPTVIAILEDKPYIGLPGNPTSAINVFNLIVAPLIRKLSGLSYEKSLPKIVGVSKVKIMGEVGRMVIQPVSFIKVKNQLFIHPILSGSGAITTLGKADGFIVIDSKVGFIDENERVEVTLLSEGIKPAGIVFVGTYSSKVDKVIGEIVLEKGFIVKKLKSNCFGGVRNLINGEADILGMAVVDPETGEYNQFLVREFRLDDVAEIISGYERRIGFVVQKGNPKSIKDLEDLTRGDVYIVNQVKNSEGRVYLEYLIKKLSEELSRDADEVKNNINGYDFLVKDYYAAIAAVVNNRADLAIAPEELVPKKLADFVPIGVEKYDLAVRRDRLEKDEVKEFIKKVKK